MADEIIKVEDIQIVPRGRKAAVNEDLLKSLKKLDTKHAVKLSSSIGEVKPTQRSNVSSVIRKHWAMVRDEDIRIDYDPNGIPQVRIRD